MTRDTFLAQRGAYNKAALCVVQAYETLAALKVQGWVNHVQLNRVYTELGEAADALMDIDPNLLGLETRKRIWDIQTERGSRE